MSKKIIIAAFLMLLAGNASAQWFDTLETIPGRYKKYYYPEWYDECPIYYTDSAKFHTSYMQIEYGDFLRENYTPRPLAVKGITVMAAIDSLDGALPIDTIRRPEYVYLYQWKDEGPDSLILVDSARWDTVTPKLMRLTTISDSAAQIDPVTYPPVVYCYAYECYFKAPHIVDSTFFIGATNNSNGQVYSEEREDYVNTNMQVTYFAIDSWHRSCYMNLVKAYWRLNKDMPWHYEPLALGRVSYFGQFLAIVDNHDLNVYPNNPEMGEVQGAGLFPDLSHDTITAIPYEGYEFLHWNDGVTDNPRVVYLTQDTTFTAVFALLTDCTVQLSANNDDWGVVDGGGTYPKYSEVTITAIPNDGFLFDRWSDGDWQNPRVITLTQDTSLTAIFDIDPTGIETTADRYTYVMPNPASGNVTVASSFRIGDIELLDLNGKSHLRTTVDGLSAALDISSLPAGTYIVRITTSAGTAYKKLVVK